jgi:hypothetical protein
MKAQSLLSIYFGTRVLDKNGRMYIHFTIQYKAGEGKRSYLPPLSCRYIPACSYLGHDFGIGELILDRAWVA